MQSLYDTNEGFKQYVDRFCKKHEIDIETAFSRSTVRDAAEYYKSIPKTEPIVGAGADMGECK